MDRPNRLREDAIRIWQAGVEAVQADRLIRRNVRIEGDSLVFGEFDPLPIPLASIGRIAVVGAGKAGAGMVAGIESIFGPPWADRFQLSGWVNVPDDCVRPTQRIRLHPARPPGVNEPTTQGVLGTERILSILRSLTPSDLCICLISGGGSALLPYPAPGISLEDKLLVTRLLSGAGANIAELNTVRKALSLVKGGGLLRACRAGWLISLIISDVLGDPLHLIASGPTVPDSVEPNEALSILEKYPELLSALPPRVPAWLRGEGRTTAPFSDPGPQQAHHFVIGNNAVAVDAAGLEAERLGYRYACVSSRSLEGPAEEIGVGLAEQAFAMRGPRGRDAVDCLISGGEPTVRLAPPEIRGKGGRNQQLALAAVSALWQDGARGIALLSGGTDGEDGPTDAAGAIVDADVIARAKEWKLDPTAYLERNDAYGFFERTGGLIKTGPTHTNVCDVRVVLVQRG
ncbi:MAG: glycerate kinase type-2 family protein [Thermogutta sp.]